MKKRIFLIDLENVGKKCLEGMEALTMIDDIYICHNRYCGNEMSAVILDGLKKTKARVHKLYISNLYKNAMDFNLCIELGALVGEYGNSADYFIVSRDKGFDVAIDFLKNRGLHTQIRRVTSILADNEAQIQVAENRKLVTRLLPECNQYEINMAIKALDRVHTTAQYHNFLQENLKPDICHYVYIQTKHLVGALA